MMVTVKLLKMEAWFPEHLEESSLWSVVKWDWRGVEKRSHGGKERVRPS